MRKYLSMLMAIVMVLSIAMGTTALAADANGITTIKVFHTNDSHSRVKPVFDAKGNLTNMGFSRVKSFIDSEKADGKLVLDAGDTLHGQPFATIENGNSIAKILKAVGYDAITPGNHDFNYGYTRLDVLAYRSGAKLLAANVVTNDGWYAADRSMTKIIDGVKVGVFGLSTPETAYKTNPNNVKGLNFGTKESVIATAEKMVKTLREDRDCDVVIAVTHLGIDETSDLKSTDIAKVEGIDLIIDGHSHDVLSNNKVENTYIASTGEYLSNLGMVTITVDKDKKVTVAPEIIPAANMKSLPEDPAVKDVIDRIDNNQKAILERVIGNTPIDLNGERNSVRGGHTNLGRLITSAMIDETGAEIAITNGGGIRASIAKGDITAGEAINVLPFGNYIVTKKIKGQDVIDALNFGMSYGAGSFPHFAGITVTVAKQNATNPDGTTKTIGKVQSVMIDGKAIDPNKMYTVATNDFMAVGGDGFTMFGSYPTDNEFAGLDEALIKYLGKITTEQFAAVDTEVRLIEK